MPFSTPAFKILTSSVQNLTIMYTSFNNQYLNAGSLGTDKADSPSVSDCERLANYMVRQGMVNRELAEKALAFSKANGIAFDEALLILESEKHEDTTSTKSHISGQEAKVLRLLIKNGLITSDKAAEITRDSLNLKISAINILGRVKELVEAREGEDEALDLLVKAGIVQDNKADQYCSRNWQLENTFRPLVIEILKGAISGSLSEAAIECAELVEEKKMSRQEAVLVLRQMTEKNISFEQASHDLGFSYGYCPEEDLDDSQAADTIKGQIKAKLDQYWRRLSFNPEYQP